MTKTFSAFLLFFFLGSPAGIAADRPNVLLIAIDDLNDWTGFLGGHPEAVTPHMDSLAKRGRIFTNAHCAAPACNPSRASVMTGDEGEELYDHKNDPNEWINLAAQRELAAGHVSRGAARLVGWVQTSQAG